MSRRFKVELKTNHPGNGWFSIWSSGGQVLLPLGKYRISRNALNAFNVAKIDIKIVPSKFFHIFFCKKIFNFFMEFLKKNINFVNCKKLKL